MRISFLAVAFVTIALPLSTSAQDGSAQDGSAQAGNVSSAEQILLGKIMTDKRTIFAQAMQLTDEESSAFWPVYDEYEAKVRKIDNQVIRLVRDYADKYASLTDADAKRMLAAKMKLDRQRMYLQQAYTKKIARAVPAIKALRYAQLEARIDNVLQHRLNQLVPLVPETTGRSTADPAQPKTAAPVPLAM